MKNACMHVFFRRPGVLKDPQIMSGVWLVIFYIVCLILARQVCVCVFDQILLYDPFRHMKHFCLASKHINTTYHHNN